jgi:hypothetical protein
LGSVKAFVDNALRKITFHEVAGSLRYVVLVFFKHGDVDFKVNLAEFVEIVEVLTDGRVLDEDGFVVVDGTRIGLLNFDSLQEVRAQCAYDRLRSLRLSVSINDRVAKVIGLDLLLNTLHNLSVGPRVFKLVVYDNRLLLDRLGDLSRLAVLLLKLSNHFSCCGRSLNVVVLANDLLRGVSGISDFEHGVLSMDSLGLTSGAKIEVMTDRALVPDANDAVSLTAVADVSGMDVLGLFNVLLHHQVLNFFESIEGHFRNFTDHIRNVIHDVFLLGFSLCRLFNEILIDGSFFGGDLVAALAVLLLSFLAFTTAVGTLFGFLLEVASRSFALGKFLTEKFDKFGISKGLLSGLNSLLCFERLLEVQLETVEGTFEGLIFSFCLFLLLGISSEGIKSTLKRFSFGGGSCEETRLIQVLSHAHHIGNVLAELGSSFFS